MLRRRGIVIHPHELDDIWLDTLEKLDLNVLGLHPVGGKDAADSLEQLLRQRSDPAFRRLLDRAGKMGLDVEYEMHALSWLLPRDLFEQHPEWFRLNEKGERINDFNFCTSNNEALEYLSGRAGELAALLPSTSHRYYFWLDDVTNYNCHCEKCASMTLSDRQLLAVNAMLRGIRQVDPEGKIAYLAYRETLEVPRSVRPEPGVFLEYAPFERRVDKTVLDPDCPENVRESACLPDLLSFFGPEGAQVLDYWLDNSLFSRWVYPPKPLTVHWDVVRSDVKAYRAMGFDSVTTFGCFLGADYRALYGMPEIDPYGEALNQN